MAHMRMQEQQYTKEDQRVYVRTYPEAKRNRQRLRANEKADEKDERDLEEALSRVNGCNSSFKRARQHDTC